MFRTILEKETTAPSVEAAVNLALGVLGCSRAEVETTILQVPARGFFGLFGRRPARVHLRLTDRAHIARRLLEHLLWLTALPARIEVLPGRSETVLRIHTDVPGATIGRRGQTLDALLSLVVLLTDRVTTERTPIRLAVNEGRTGSGESPRVPHHSRSGNDQGNKGFPGEAAHGVPASHSFTTPGAVQSGSIPARGAPGKIPARGPQTE